MNTLKTEPLAIPTDTPETLETAPTAQAGEAATPRSSGSPSPVQPDVSRKTPGKLFLYIAVAIFGFFATELFAQLPGWLKQAHDRRVNTAINTITPESVLSRCGAPIADLTADLYPMISRRMTYSSPIGGSPASGQGRPGNVTLSFSRTAEESSTWVYSSMKNEAGNTSYETPEQQIAALPCLAAKN